MPRKATGENETLKRIMNCAERLFAKQGYSGTSTRQLANAAGISIQTLHYHYGGKKNLYDKVLEHSIIPVTKAINGHIQNMIELDLKDDSVLADSINKLIDDLFGILHEHPHYPSLFFRQWLEQDSELRRVEWEKLVPYIRKWVSQVEEKIDEKRRHGIDLPLTFISLSLVYWGLFSNPPFISGFLNMKPESLEYIQRLKTHAKEITAKILGAGSDSISPRRKGKHE